MIATIAAPIVMLVAEDNPADVVYFNEALEASETRADVRVVNNGRDVLRYMRREAPFHAAASPDILVLDLNLPIKNGHDVIQEMMADPELKEIPVAILTTSTSESYLCAKYTPGRCVYFTKTDDFKRLQEIIKRIASFARENLAHDKNTENPAD
jgi:two-component system, chemotaxis family, response regulator Rcp1